MGRKSERLAHRASRPADYGHIRPREYNCIRCMRNIEAWELKVVLSSRVCGHPEGSGMPIKDRISCMDCYRALENRLQTDESGPKFKIRELTVSGSRI